MSPPYEWYLRVADLEPPGTKRGDENGTSRVHSARPRPLRRALRARIVSFSCLGSRPLETDTGYRLHLIKITRENLNLFYRRIQVGMIMCPGKIIFQISYNSLQSVT